MRTLEHTALRDVCREVVLIRKIIIASLLAAAAVGLVAGCGSGEDPAALLADCGKAVDTYAQGSGYLHFVQETEYRLGTSQGEFGQELRVEGDIIFPDREAYEYRETLSSSEQPEQPQENAFSYLTLDGGRTAYVMGKRLSAELGVLGWIHYTPLSDQNRYFDYVASVSRLTSVGGEPEWLGYEDLNGDRCARVRYSVTGQELVDLRLQDDPSFAEQYQGLDMGEIMGELLVEMWIGEADDLPLQVVMDQTVSLEDGTNSTTRLLMVFSAYGEEPPLLIEAPAFFNEAV